VTEPAQDRTAVGFVLGSAFAFTRVRPPKFRSTCTLVSFGSVRRPTPVSVRPGSVNTNDVSLVIWLVRRS